MADQASFKAQAEAVKLRQNPRPITRVNRKVLVLGGALGLVLLMAGMAVAFSPPKLVSNDAPREVYAQPAGLPEGLANMPVSYDAVPSSVPELGPALPGEFGAALLETERRRGLSPPELPDYDEEPFRSNAQRDALRAERIREAELQAKARQAPVFFQLSGTPTLSSASASHGGQMPYAAPDAFAAFSSAPAMPDLNMQDRKRAFASQISGDIYNGHRLQGPISPYQIMAGSIIPASLITGVNSDLPGTVVAQVTQNVFDTVRGDHLLIPQGARLVGRYDSGVTFGQDRALLVWDRIIFPDGKSLLIDALPGTDAMGHAGLKDRVNHHWGRVAGAAALATLLGVGAELAADDDADDIGRAVRDAFQDTGGRAGEALVNRQLGIQPTIRIRPGARVQIMVTRDLVLEPYETGDPRQ